MELPSVQESSIYLASNRSDHFSIRIAGVETTEQERNTVPTTSFIVPCYNEEDNIERFYLSFAESFNSSPFDWQLIFIDDGSTDGTWKHIEALCHTHDEVEGMQLTRNFGKEAAIWAGLNNTRADIIGIIDADLQQPPSDAMQMCKILVENPEYDCVAAFQKSRLEHGPLKNIKHAFYGIFSKLSGLDALQNASDFRVFRQNVADAILQLPESFRFSKGIFAWIGFNTCPYPYTAADRQAGQSKWSIVGLTKYAIDGMLAFSVTPLRLATVLGLVAAVCAVVYFLIVLVQTLIHGVDVPGYATLISVVLLLGGAQLICMGIMGEYLARTYLQGKQRPIYLVKTAIRSDSPQEPSTN